MRYTEWRKLPSFRWKKLEQEEWCCALHGRILFLRQDSTHLHYRASWPKVETVSLKSKLSTTPMVDDDTELLVRSYLNLTPNLTQLYETWSLADSNFKKRAPKFIGVRILKQDAWEALVGFICSSNNNIIRISQMVHNLCLHYGPLLGYVADQPFHDFPSPEALTGPGVEAHLRELGFGYRAKYLARTAVTVAKERPAGWLDRLSNKSDVKNKDMVLEVLKECGSSGYRKAHEELLQLHGVGPKVADCVCLMGLGWGEAVPVDTHVWQIAQRDYRFGKGKHKSLTKATYDAIGDHFRSLWGKEAGWAHSVLFAADLRTFSIRLAVETEVGMEEVLFKQEDGILQESAVRKRQIVTEQSVKEEPESKLLLGGKVTSQRRKRIK